MRSDPARATGARRVHLIGNVDLDLVLGPVAPWPEVGTERIVARREARVGGAAGVAALALQALGVPFRLHARIGDDAFGEVVREGLGTAGAQLEVVRAGTAVSVGVAHPDGERTFLTHLGHLEELDLEAIANELEGGPPGLVLLCGSFLMPPLRGGGGLELARRAHAAGHELLFDSGWPSEGFTAPVRAELDALAPHLTLALPNLAEATGWTGTADVEAALRALERRGVRAVVKRGAEGASWLEGGEVRSVAAPRVEVADSVGAGDAFNAALIAALARRVELPAAVAQGVAYASAVVASQPRGYPQRVPG